MYFVSDIHFADEIDPLKSLSVSRAIDFLHLVGVITESALKAVLSNTF